jgi:DNA polymerase-3 subunit epsilon
MTRGQDALVIDMADGAGGAEVLVQVDFAAFTLPVLLASEEEASAHEALLADLDKASGGKTVWRIALA